VLVAWGLRALYLHVDEAWFKCVKPALRKPPEGCGEGSGRVGEALLVLFTVEEGDDEGVVSEAAGDIVGHAGRLGVDTILLYPYAHLSSRLAPPSQAYRLSVMLEERVRGSWRGRVVRAPFGWYKAFGFSCKGHPLAELSRSFSPWGGGPAWQGWLKEWPQRVREAWDRLGFSGPLGARALWELRLLAEAELGASGGYAWAQVGPVEAVRLCLAGRGVVAGPGPGFEVVGGEGGAGSVESAVSRLFEESGLPAPALEERGGLLYASGRLVGGAGGGRACLGPLASLAMLLVEEGLKAAEEKGLTPRLPFWLTPLQVAVIPVGGGAQLAGELHRWLLSVGARSVLMAEGGLGQRVR
jgi:threonyl-tRNA synthetase